MKKKKFGKKKNGKDFSKEEELAVWNRLQKQMILIFVVIFVEGKFTLINMVKLIQSRFEKLTT